jgi:hypothetical protein
MRYWLLYIYLLTAYSAVSRAGETAPDHQRYAKTADSLGRSGKSYLSSVYYRKAAHFSEGAAQRAGYLLKAAGALAELREYSEAIDLLNKMDTYGLPDSMVYAVKYQAAFISYLNREFSRSEGFIVQARYLVTDSSLLFGSYVLQALAMNELLRWDDARATLLAGVKLRYRGSDSLGILTSWIEALYHSDSLPKIRNREKAMRMSTFFPGLGQTYAGYPGEGLISFGAVTVTSAVALIGILNQYYFTSIFLGNYVFAKFYQGGIARTGFLTDKRNYQRAYAFNRRLRERLLQTFPEGK